jgi:hypothetical protein
MPTAAEDIAALASRASISGVQAKLLAVETATGFRPAREGELSTHIAKFPSGNLPEIVEFEQLSTLAARILLPDDRVAEAQIAPVEGISGECLLIRRFDRLRTDTGAVIKLHFEEFNQVLVLLCYKIDTFTLILLALAAVRRYVEGHEPPPTGFLSPARASASLSGRFDPGSRACRSRCTDRELHQGPHAADRA